MSEIDPNKKYRTADGRSVRIYATDGGMPNRVHGALWSDDYGWLAESWNINGKKGIPCCELVEVTLADELREMIPWSALRPDIRWVAMRSDGEWWAYRYQPEQHADPYPPHCGWSPSSGGGWQMDLIAMPRVSSSRWRETLVERPEDT